MTRRQFLPVALAGVARAPEAPLVVPVHQIVDQAVKWRPGRLPQFWSGIWRESLIEFGRCGIRIESTVSEGELERPRGRQPVITGLVPGALNVVLTDRIPIEWDRGLALSGVTTLYRGYHLCMIALNRAHGNQIPFLSTNTCVHEILHALLLDIFASRPRGAYGELREYRVDYYATCLWLLHQGSAVRKSAALYLQRFTALALPGPARTTPSALSDRAR